MNARTKNLIFNITNTTSDTVLTIEPHLKVFDAYKKIDNSELKTKYQYSSSLEAFDTACISLKKLLKELNYKEIEGGFIYE